MTIPNPIPKYTKWDQVPANLYTRTQLGKLDPPRRIRKDTPVRGRALYMGNKYADLYALDDTEVKPVASEKQVAAARRAGELRYICRWCHHIDDTPLPSRICDDCGWCLRAYGWHLQHRASLGGLHHEAFEFGPLYAACAVGGDDRWPTRIVVIDPERDCEIIADREMPAVGWDEHGRPLTLDVDVYRAAVTGLVDRPVFAWRLDVGPVRSVWWDYARWLGHKHPPQSQGMPGATGDLAADARTLAALIGGIVSGTLQPPAPSWIDRGITPAQMRPYVTQYTTRDVVEFTNRLDVLR